MPQPPAPMFGNHLQNEFKTVQDFLGNEFGQTPVSLTSRQPGPDHIFFVRTGGFFQWTMPGVPMSRKWEIHQRALAARLMASLAFAHWEATNRPASMNVGRAVTTKDSNKILWFLDI